MDIDPKKIKPKRNVVLVELVKPPDVTKGGIHIPETAQDRQKLEHRVGKVLAVGPGKKFADDPSDARIPTDTKKGDIVLFDPPYAAAVRGHPDLFLVEDDAILATVTE